MNLLQLGDTVLMIKNFVLEVSFCSEGLGLAVVFLSKPLKQGFFICSKTVSWHLFLLNEIKENRFKRRVPLKDPSPLLNA